MNLIKLIPVLMVGIFATFLFGCSAAYDVWDGPPRYNTDGKKTSGRDLDIDEVLEYQVVMSNVKSLNKQGERTSTDDEAEGLVMNSNGQLRGNIINNSARRLEVSFYNKRGKYKGTVSIPKHSMAEIFLTPGKDYVCYKNEGKKNQREYRFNVMPDVQDTYVVEYRSGETEKLIGGFFIDDQKFK